MIRNINRNSAFYHSYAIYAIRRQPGPVEYKNLKVASNDSTVDEKAEVESKLKNCFLTGHWKKRQAYFLGWNLDPMTKGTWIQARYTAFVARTAEKTGFSWGLLAIDSDFIVYNIEKETWVDPILNALMKSSRKWVITSLTVLSHHRTCRTAYGGS